MEIPDSVASIGSNAFYNCTALKNVYYSSCSEAKWNSISIQSGNDDLKNAAMHYSDHRWDEGVITKPATRTGGRRKDLHLHGLPDDPNRDHPGTDAGAGQR